MLLVRSQESGVRSQESEERINFLPYSPVTGPHSLVPSPQSPVNPLK
ncbi:MAG: hypothetical protein ACKPEO_20205 [Sphaerospermopsis kisseleviana]